MGEHGKLEKGGGKSRRDMTRVTEGKRRLLSL